MHTLHVLTSRCLCFILLGIVFGALENLSISPGLEMLRMCNNFKVEYVNFRNGLASGSVEEC